METFPNPLAHWNTYLLLREKKKNIKGFFPFQFRSNDPLPFQRALEHPLLNAAGAPRRPPRTASFQTPCLTQPTF